MHIIQLDSCLRMGWKLLQHYTYPQGPPSVCERKHVVSFAHISSHTTHTSPYRRHIGKHIWRKRFDAHAGQAQTARFCRARAVSREQTRRVDTENTIAKDNGALKSTQVSRPVFAQSQQGNPRGTWRVKVSLTRHKIVSAWIVQAPLKDRKGLEWHQGTDSWGNIRSARVSKITDVTAKHQNSLCWRTLEDGWTSICIWIAIASTSIYTSQQGHGYHQGTGCWSNIELTEGSAWLFTCIIVYPFPKM